MGEALRQSGARLRRGRVPVGAVVVREGRIIARAYNQVELLKDATSHAEMLALTQAEQVVGDWVLTGCTVVRDQGTMRYVRRCRGAYPLLRVVYGAVDSESRSGGKRR